MSERYQMELVSGHREFPCYEIMDTASYPPRVVAVATAPDAKMIVRALNTSGGAQ